MKYKTLLASTGFLSVLAGVAVGYWNCIPNKLPKIEKGIFHTLKKKENYISIDSLDNAFLSSVKIEASKTLEEKCEEQLNKVGSGVLLSDPETGDHYVLSVEHIVPDQYYDCSNPAKKMKVIEGRITVDAVKAALVKKEETADLALFKLEEKLSSRIPFSGRIATDVQRGDYVLGVGFPDGIKKYFISSVGDIRSNAVHLNMLVVGGNSGGGVFKINEESLELVGIVKNFPAGITPLEKTREFLQGTPLEDDYLVPKYFCK